MSTTESEMIIAEALVNQIRDAFRNNERLPRFSEIELNYAINEGYTWTVRDEWELHKEWEIEHFGFNPDNATEQQWRVHLDDDDDDDYDEQMAQLLRRLSEQNSKNNTTKQQWMEQHGMYDSEEMTKRFIRNEAAFDKTR